MNIQTSKAPIGLDGVPAAETALSHVDGAKGELIIAGQFVAELAENTSFEGVTARLWSAATETPISEAEVRAALGAARVRAFAHLPQMLAASEGLSVVDGFRAAVASLRSYQWLVFTSQNGVRAFFTELARQGLDSRQLYGLRIAAIGPSTAQALEPYGVRCDVMPDTSFRGEALAEIMLREQAGSMQGVRVLLPRG